MTPAPTRGTRAGQVYSDLRNLARKDGRDPAEYLTLYVLEGFLARLAVSTAAEDFVLKGGVLMAAFAARRPTRDIDLAATGFQNDIPEVESRVNQIIEQRLDDGLVLDPDFVDIAAITRTHQITYTDQRAAIEVVAAYRQTPLGTLQPLLKSMPDAAGKKWQVWRRKQHLEATTPEYFEDLLNECIAFADPTLDRSAAGATWNPSALTWEKPPVIMKNGSERP